MFWSVTGVSSKSAWAVHQLVLPGTREAQSFGRLQAVDSRAHRRQLCVLTSGGRPVQVEKGIAALPK